MVSSASAMHTSHADATYAPRRVALVSIIRPTTLNHTHNVHERTSGLKGSILCASGLTYCSQLVSRLRNLSRPAREGHQPQGIL